MTDRLTCRARELTDDSYIFHAGHNEIRHIAKAYTVGDRTYLIYAAGAPGDFEADGVVALATKEEIADYRREQDRFAVARALARLGSQICDRGLPVPPGGEGIVVSLYLADDADLEPWADYLSTRPRRGTAMPLIQADAEGVEINVYRSGEFGPDLAEVEPAGTVAQEFGPMYADDLSDVALAESMLPAGAEALAINDVEHRDSVGAFPVVPQRVGWAPPLTDAPKPAPDGWPLGDGHRPQVDEDAMRADRYNGEG